MSENQSGILFTDWFSHIFPGVREWLHMLAAIKKKELMYEKHQQCV